MPLPKQIVNNNINDNSRNVADNERKNKEKIKKGLIIIYILNIFNLILDVLVKNLKINKS